MILADTSAWIEFLRDTGSRVHRRLRAELRAGEVAITDPVLLEVMSGARPGTDDALLRLLSEQHYLPVTAREDWLDAAALYRTARRTGLTVRSGVECLLATVAIRHGVAVLHHDRDFTALARISPLVTLES